MTGIERIETFRSWRSLCNRFPDKYHISIKRTKTAIVTSIQEAVPFDDLGYFDVEWITLDSLPDWDTSYPPSLTLERAEEIRPNYAKLPLRNRRKKP